MTTFSSKEAKNRLGEVFRAAGREPVLITHHGRPFMRVSPAAARDASGAHRRLDRLKHAISCEVAARHPLSDIRAKSIANLQRWRDQGTWGPAYDEWLQIVVSGSDAQLLRCLVGLDENSNRLRQSMPYVGMLDQDTLRRLREET